MVFGNLVMVITSEGIHLSVQHNGKGLEMQILVGMAKAFLFPGP